MKKIILFLFMVPFLSCEGDTMEVSEKLTFKNSVSLRFNIQMIREIKGLISLEDSNNHKITRKVPSELCFDFEYPVTVQYNDSSTVSVTSFSYFIQLILTETQDLHMVGIGFPFNIIKSDNTKQLISNETEFENLIEGCGYGTLYFDEIKNVYESCFTFNYPVSVIINDNNYTFNSESDAVSLAAAFSQKVINFNFIYPFTIKYTSNDQNANVPDFYTFTSIITNCN